MGPWQASRPIPLVMLAASPSTSIRGPTQPGIEHERAVAILDLLEENHFAPTSGCGGPFHLYLAIEENR